MTIAELQASLSEQNPPEGLSLPPKALWFAAKGNWERAHLTVQDDPSPEAAWVHAYLHKQEGDQSNARYWYVRSNRNTMKLSLKEEWEKIVTTLLPSH